jgi:hypothetical protein
MSSYWLGLTRTLPAANFSKGFLSHVSSAQWAVSPSLSE